ncbi:MULTISPECIES: ParB/RepB/Spo0J family partition protein [Legionella]|uniref:Probable chromosome-partitioning protein ParB n=1 Tax=Legionella maceachernii TaxID=466 RepID=A0A0W0W6N1_9GAMM|nr:ParB/RepB/Spo0J family partition protein [Legionella maceachernii]KTD27992.1 chromosome partitioning protein ParB [Legionella maceachernii]SKA06438.1 chromosome partitioning protein, ParB family [Legionella maceachernii]SUO99890.1 Probable chromosome-partitioning protein parB [Legionella maceachernii]
MKTQFKLIPIECLQPGQYQPRMNFEEKGLQELAQSIATQGLIEPLVVRELAKARYEIIAGERRWRAAMLAGIIELPCLIGDYSDSQAAAVTLIENIQRQDLNLIEEAYGYRRLLQEFHFQQDEIAILVGKSRSHIANILRLLTLCEPVQQRLRAGQLSLGHARMLVGLPVAQQIGFAEQIEMNDWSVRQLEKKVRALKTHEQPLANSRKDRDIERLQTQLAEQIGAPVQIINDHGNGGWLQVKFFDNDTLAGLLERMGLRYD